jgi:hypothetical protein
MEDFHVAHLSDAQMKELNPIIRNAIFEVLTAFELFEQSDATATRFLHFLHLMIPDYWEPPQLTKEFVESWEKAKADPL